LLPKSQEEIYHFLFDFAFKSILQWTYFIANLNDQSINFFLFLFETINRSISFNNCFLFHFLINFNLNYYQRYYINNQIISLFYLFFSSLFILLIDSRLSQFPLILYALWPISYIYFPLNQKHILSR